MPAETIQTVKVSADFGETKQTGKLRATSPNRTSEFCELYLWTVWRKSTTRAACSVFERWQIMAALKLDGYLVEHRLRGVTVLVKGTLRPPPAQHPGLSCQHSTGMAGDSVQEGRHAKIVLISRQMNITRRAPASKDMRIRAEHLNVAPSGLRPNCRSPCLQR